MEKKSRVLVGDVTFFPSEVNLILFIHMNPDENVTQMATQLGITKGAVSQTLARLEKKGVLRRSKIPGTKNESLVELLPFGLDVANRCLLVRRELDAKFGTYLTNVSSEEKKTISRFMGYLIETFNEETEKLQ
ncbi:MarR family transcriptional regulator [Ruegeria sp. ANG-R]|uniref:MarR family winged helix-turn-helix transcriptional regulator n=1 Tax=Ruegeria sp. ANG-R TaxID=1577903 RepID=UPI00187BCFB7|nr:MarR family transcriptional regulator [Ruegeria sp. ANG-R]